MSETTTVRQTPRDLRQYGLVICINPVGNGSGVQDRGRQKIDDDVLYFIFKNVCIENKLWQKDFQSVC